MGTLEIDAPRAVSVLTRALSAEFTAAGFTRAVVGLSGGVDSALATALAARALGTGNVLALLMPYRSSSETSLMDAAEVVTATGVNHIVVEITPQIDAYFDRHRDADSVRRGNKMARERMSVLFDHAKRTDALVVGTSNRSEILLGYATIFGDSACSLNPLGRLYKTQVYALARELALPKSVLTKPPSADLWAGQTDEEELGFSYEVVDPLLVALFDDGRSRDECVGMGFDPELVDRVIEIHERTAYKRRLPPILDWRD